MNNVSFNIKEGQSFGLVGESGSGKSTIAKMIVNLFKPSSGDIYFDNVGGDILDTALGQIAQGARSVNIILSLIIAIVLAIGGRVLFSLPLFFLALSALKIKGLTAFQMFQLWRLIQFLKKLSVLLRKKIQLIQRKQICYAPVIKNRYFYR